MRIRKTDADGDWVFGGGLADFHIDSPDGVALLAVYRLSMDVGDWWLDLSAGTPWQTQVIGRRTEATRDPVIRGRLLGTPGLRAILSYSSNLDRETRRWSVSATVMTDYSTSITNLTIPLGVLS